jgi:hypothetical protein
MLLPMLLLALSMPRQLVQSFDCANFLDRATEVYSNAEGMRVALRVHAADDHIKDTHLCQTDYSFAVTRRDGTTQSENWNRSTIRGADPSSFGSTGLP